MLRGCIGFLLLPVQPLYAQLWLTAQTYAGTTLRIHPQYPTPTQTATGIEAGIEWAPDGAAMAGWGSPRAGLVLLHAGTGHPDVLGRGYALLPYLRWTTQPWHGWRASCAVGFSLAWLDRPYDRVTNPTNIATGHALNNLTMLRVQASYEARGPLVWHLALSGFHFSNGHTRYPNLGLNIVGVATGVGYRLGEAAPVAVRSGRWRRVPLRPGLRLGYGISGGKAPDGPLYPMYTLLVETPWAHWGPATFTAALMGFQSGYVQAFVRDHEVPVRSPSRAALGLTANAGARLALGHFAFQFRVGPYLRRPYLMDYFLYTELGWEWHFVRPSRQALCRPYVGLYVHSHSGEADFATCAWGVAF
ncbi:MAG: hypothetical protein OHK0039_03130 [Bacteroidia bacterium]